MCRSLFSGSTFDLTFTEKSNNVLNCLHDFVSRRTDVPISTSNNTYEIDSYYLLKKKSLRLLKDFVPFVLQLRPLF